MVIYPLNTTKMLKKGQKWAEKQRIIYKKIKYKKRKRAFLRPISAKNGQIKQKLFTNVPKNSKVFSYLAQTGKKSPLAPAGGGGRVWLLEEGVS